MLRIVPENINIDFVGKRKTMLSLSAIVVLVGLALFLVLEPNYGIDFKGGTDIILAFEEDVAIDEVREAAKSVGFADANVNTFGTTGRQFMVQTAAVSVVDAASIETVKASLKPLGNMTKASWSPEQPDRLDVVFEGEIKGADDKQTGDATAEGGVDASKAIQAAAVASGLSSVEVSRVGVEGDFRYVIRFQDLQNKVENGFAESFGERFNRTSGLERLETVGPRVGKQLKESGILSILISLLFILIYVAFRFDIRYAPGAVVALAHDVIVCMGFLVAIDLLPIYTYEINLPTIAALLTIVGYSLNDTIVVFDRIRENLIEEGDANTEAIVNRSLNETLSRTLITSITTLLAVLAIFFFGGGLIKDFALALIIGILVGTYSSIFVASPVMLFMDKHLRTQREFKARNEALSS